MTHNWLFDIARDVRGINAYESRLQVAFQQAVNHSAPRASVVIRMGLGLALEVAKYWKQDVHSDIDVVLELNSGLDQDATTDQPDAMDNNVLGPSTPAVGNTCILQRVPGHKIVLSSSPYFEAQVSVTAVWWTDLELQSTHPMPGGWDGKVTITVTVTPQYPT